MERQEKEKILYGFDRQLDLGLPIDVCYGTVEQQKKHLVGKLKAVLETLVNDEPVGTTYDGKYYHCPRCKKVVGSSGWFCKWCGVMLREPDY